MYLLSLDCSGASVITDWALVNGAPQKEKAGLHPSGFHPIAQKRKKYGVRKQPVCHWLQAHQRYAARHPIYAAYPSRGGGQVSDKRLQWDGFEAKFLKEKM